jgi:hypothetical protein
MKAQRYPILAAVALRLCAVSLLAVCISLISENASASSCYGGCTHIIRFGGGGAWRCDPAGRGQPGYTLCYGGPDTVYSFCLYGGFFCYGT